MWPLNPSNKQIENIEEKAQAILEARKTFPNCTLADLYSPLLMPPLLRKAHQECDKAVDKLYGKEKFHSERERVEHLFKLYQNFDPQTQMDLSDKKTKTKAVKKSRKI